MTNFFKSDDDDREIGGEIHQDRKRQERTMVTIFGIIAILVVNLILYFMSNHSFD